MSTQALVDVLLAFADDEHLIGQQHTEWIGIAPFLEEDLAFSSIGQDELGHAALLYEEVLRVQGVDIIDREIDQLAYRRADEYRSCALVEYSTDQWSQALVRHWIYDTVEVERWQLFLQSTHLPLRAIAATALRDEHFHRRHADALLDELLRDKEACIRIDDALITLLPIVPTLLVPAPYEGEAIAAGYVSGSVADLDAILVKQIARRFGPDFTAPGANRAGTTTATLQQDRTQRSQYFGPLMARMREVLDLDLTAIW